MAEDPTRLGCDKCENPKTIMIDYGGPNVAKPLHVGHLRSAIIGERVKRIFFRVCVLLYIYHQRTFTDIGITVFFHFFYHIRNIRLGVRFSFPQFAG